MGDSITVTHRGYEFGGLVWELSATNTAGGKYFTRYGPLRLVVEPYPDGTGWLGYITRSMSAESFYGPYRVVYETRKQDGKMNTREEVARRLAVIAALEC